MFPLLVVFELQAKLLCCGLAKGSFTKRPGFIILEKEQFLLFVNHEQTP